MIVRELVALLGFQVDNGSEDKVEGAIGKIKKMAGALAAVFAAKKTFDALDSLVNGVRELGDRVDKVSQQIGVNAQSLQELSYAAGLAGASNEDVVGGLRDLQKNALEAANGSQSFADMFNRLGVTVKDSSGKLKSAEELLPQLADGFAGLTSDTERTAIAQKLLGGAGTKLIPLLKQGTDAIEAQRLEARKLGGILDAELIKSSAELTDAQARQAAATQGLRNVVAKYLIPIWIKSAESATQLATILRGPLERAVKVLVEIFKGLSLIAKTIIDGFLEINNLIVFMAKEFLGLNESITQVVIILGVLIALLGLPIVLLGLIGAAIFLIIDDFIAMGEGGESVIGSLIGEFNALLDEVGSISGAIGEMLVTALSYWLGTSREKIKEWVDLIWDEVTGVFKAIGEFWGDLAANFFFGDNEAPRNAAKTAASINNASPSVGRSGFPGASPVAAGGASVNQNTTVSVNVNSSKADPAAVAGEAAQKFEAAQERLNRKTLNQLAPQGA